MTFRMVLNLDRSFQIFVTIHACDRQTDRQTDRILIPCSAVTSEILWLAIA